MNLQPGKQRGPWVPGKEAHGRGAEEPRIDPGHLQPCDAGIDAVGSLAAQGTHSSAAVLFPAAVLTGETLQVLVGRGRGGGDLV